MTIRERPSRLSICARLGFGLLTLGGCIGDGRPPPPPSCGHVEPCGGDLVGTWQMQGACIDLAAASADADAACPGSRVSAWTIAVAGTLVFDGTQFSGLDVIAQMSETTERAIGCTGNVDCASLSTSVSDPQMGSASLRCSGTTSCTCRLAATETLGVGSYRTSGDELTLDAASSTTLSYCVQDGRLHLITPSTSMNTGPMGQAAITADIVARRR